jgi:dihydroorotase
MPNTVPQATTQELLEEKFKIAAKTSYANFSFMFGGTNDNLEELLKTDPKKVAAIKLFLGSSTGNMLVDNEQVLEKIFSSTDMLIAVHCEDEATVKKNLEEQKAIYGEDIPIELHPIIRSEEACYLSSSKAIELAKKTGARLHVFHLSTAKETTLFRNDIPLEEKKITAEVCIHHLWFDDSDYAEKGTHIKWNPAVKTKSDREGLWKALLDDRIDVIATDHAPHTLEEKNNKYASAPSGGPLVQHALPALLNKCKEGKITIEKIVEKMCHNPAKLFQIEKRGYIKKGYYADLVLVDTNSPWTVTRDSVLYKCGWSPFEGTTFQSKISRTFVNGHLMYDQGKFNDTIKGKRITFNR